MFKFLSGIVDSNEKELKRLQPKVDRINELEPEFQKLSDAELRAKTDEFKARLKAGDSLDDILPEAFAAVREAARRTLGQRHYDVQLLGGITLHQGKIAEMRTGEGKTLVATLPLYLNSLTGKGVHLATVNDYLARRDPYWMAPVYHALGVSVASIYPMQNPDEYSPSRIYDPDYDSGESRWRHFKPITRAEAYQADITYGTSSEFGFDYLRDNMVNDLKRCVQRPLNFAIVDEVDNLLIDEARTPLIISAPAEESGQTYAVFARLVPRLRAEEDYTVEEKSRTVNLTDNGISSMERMLRREGLLKSPDLYDPSNHGLTRYLDNALRAQVVYKRDRDYVVKDGEVIIVDEFTGRLMYGRRYAEGLHQAIEAKEHVKVQRESMTYATITIQNYFRMYKKLGGMTGTAATEAEEFYKIYKLEVTEIPTNKPMIREDMPDLVYKTEEAKFRAVVDEIKTLHEQGVPVLVGTVSIEKSEHLQDLLKRQGITCEVLNAKEHLKEGEIVRNAGEPGAVTVATNMAGRGVDIILGGDPGFNSYGEVFQTIENYVCELLTPLVGEAEIEKTLQKCTAELKDVSENGNRLQRELNEIIDKIQELDKNKKENEAALNTLHEERNEKQKQLFDIFKKLQDTAKILLEQIKKDYPIEEDERFIEIYEKIERYVKCIQDHYKVIELGGLHIIGTERHEARRIDNQLRGRAGRQGDPGRSRFYVSLEDDIMRRFGGERVKGVMDWVGMDEDTPIEHNMITKVITDVQKRVEGYHFDVRKHLVEYDDVVNKHRELIYEERQKILAGADLKANIIDMVKDEIKGMVANRLVGGYEEGWDIPGLLADVKTVIPVPPSVNEKTLSEMSSKEIEEQLDELVETLYEEKEKQTGPEAMRVMERLVMLQVIDRLWVEHLTAMEHERLQAGWQTLRQVKSADAYKRAGFENFELLKETIRHDVAHTIFHTRIEQRGAKPAPAAASPMAQAAQRPGGNGSKKQAILGKKIGRNAPCPCGSGKKYKYCCGR